MIRYEIKGNGRAVILLHGWGQNMEMMRPIQDHLAKRYRVLNLDLPGFFGSDAPASVWGSLEYAAWLHEFAEANQLQEPILIAHSFGARIAFQYALHYPTACMILTGAAGIRKRRTLRYYGKVAFYKIRKKLHLPISKSGSEDYRQAQGMMRKIMVKVVNETITPDLFKIKTPTLLVWGEQDEQTPLWMGKMMEKQMPHATLVVFHHDDHFAYYHQLPRFLRVIDAYLEGGFL